MLSAATSYTTTARIPPCERCLTFLMPRRSIAKMKETNMHMLLWMEITITLTALMAATRLMLWPARKARRNG